MINVNVVDCRLTGETESTVQDVLVQEVMAVEAVAFKTIALDIDSIKIARKFIQSILFKWIIKFVSRQLPSDCRGWH